MVETAARVLMRHATLVAKPKTRIRVELGRGTGRYRG
jgi:hypothetical protein